MKSFDAQYQFLQEMYQDNYYPEFLVDKIKALLVNMADYLAEGDHQLDEIQERFDYMTRAINDLAKKFEDNDSEIETVARDAIATDVIYMLDWFDLAIDVEDALGERDW